MKKISIFGSTGSIGTNTIDIIQKAPAGDFRILALTANNNYHLLAKQAQATNTELAVIANEQHYSALKDLLQHTKIKVAAGDNGMAEAVAMNNDLVVAGIVGAAGLKTTYGSIINGTDVALVNKESLVCAGNIMIEAAKKHQINLIPTDSEHSAIFQCLEPHNKHTIDKITLTASGGPFRQFSQQQLASVTVEQAIAHPKWKMGAKISTDCATMINKGLEIIEAHYLFDVDESAIDILIHPESIIHSLVSYKDGSSLAQLGNADMRIPISYALYWPKRSQTHIAATLDLATISSLHFERPNHQRFPALNLCRNALRASTAHTIMLNASNEIVVSHFLQQKLKFIDIVETIEIMLERVKAISITNIEDAIEYDNECRTKTMEYLAGSV